MIDNTVLWEFEERPVKFAFSKVPPDTISIHLSEIILGSIPQVEQTFVYTTTEAIAAFASDDKELLEAWVADKLPAFGNRPVLVLDHNDVQSARQLKILVIRKR